MKKLLKPGDAWVNTRGKAPDVPLRLAARVGRDQICRLLLDQKADPNDFEQGNGYPIMFDAIRHPMIVRMLVGAGENLRRRITWLGGRTGVWFVGDEATALHYAVEAGNLESVRILVEAGLDVNAADVEGQTPLHIAVLFESMASDGRGDTAPFVDVIRYLVVHDASLRFTDRHGRTPLDLAKELKSRKEVMELLTEASEPRKRN